MNILNYIYENFLKITDVCKDCNQKLYIPHIMLSDLPVECRLVKCNLCDEYVCKNCLIAGYCDCEICNTRFRLCCKDCSKNHQLYYIENREIHYIENVKIFYV
jgi:hypothetical protein